MAEPFWMARERALPDRNSNAAVTSKAASMRSSTARPVGRRKKISFLVSGFHIRNAPRRAINAHLKKRLLIPCLSVG